jgi:hypothetical protein
MNTQGMADLTADGSIRFPLKEETRRIIGCSFEVLNVIGHGL